MSPPLTGHRDDCSGAQRASWHPVLSLLSQSLSHPSLPFCLLLRQALMHAYIIGLGKAWGAGTGRVGEAEEGGVWVFGGAHRKYSEGKDHRELPQIHQGFPSDIFCVFSSEPGSPLSFLHPKWAHRQEHTNQIMTQSGGMWKIYFFFLLHWHIFFICCAFVCRRMSTRSHPWTPAWKTWSRACPAAPAPTSPPASPRATLLWQVQSDSR